MEAKIEEFEGGKIVHIAGRLDLAGGEVVENELAKLRAVPLDNHHVIINFEGVNYISSSGLRVIVSAFKVVDEQGGKMTLCGMNIAVEEVFEFAGLTEVFTITDSVTEARER